MHTQDTASLPRLRVARQGSAAGVPVVMAHALGMRLSMWDALAERLAPRHPVLRWDHRGQGDSAPVDAGYDIHALVADAARVITEAGVGPVLFVGLSMGGMVGQGLAIAHPRLVRGLLLANTAASFAEPARLGLAQRADAVSAGGMAAVADGVLERFLSPACRAAQPALAATVHAQLLGADPKGYAAACRALIATDWRDALGAIAVPTAVVAGRQDLGSTVAMAEELAARIAGATLTMLDTAHLSVLEDPHGFAAVLDSLLLRL